MRQTGALLERGWSGLRLGLCEPWSERVPRYLQEHDIREIRLGIMEPDEAPSLDALASLQCLEGVTLELGAGINPKPLEQLRNLRYLDLWGKGRRGFDYGAFPNLEWACVQMKRTAAETVLGCRNLRHLEVEGWKGQNLEPLAGLNLLEYLKLYRGNLESFEGIGGLTSLRYLEGSSLSKLKELRFSENLSNLTVLNIIDCPGLTTVSTLQNAPALRVLQLKGIKGIASLRPLSALKQLEWLDFSDTRILDNDLSVVAELEQQKLWLIRFDESPLYSHCLRSFHGTHVRRSSAEEQARIRDRLRESNLPYMKHYLESAIYWAYLSEAYQRGDTATTQRLFQAKTAYYYEKFYEAVSEGLPLSTILDTLEPLEQEDGPIAW